MAGGTGSSMISSFLQLFEKIRRKLKKEVARVDLYISFIIL
jgi:hypothetical protein